MRDNPKTLNRSGVYSYNNNMRYHSPTTSNITPLLRISHAQFNLQTCILFKYKGHIMPINASFGFTQNINISKTFIYDFNKTVIFPRKEGNTLVM